jgi:hypothetical protein
MVLEGQYAGGLRISVDPEAAVISVSMDETDLTVQGRSDSIPSERPPPEVATSETAAPVEPEPVRLLDQDGMARLLFDLLKDVESFDVADVRTQAPYSELTDQRFGLMLHDVRERLRKELRLEFIVKNGGRSRPGFYELADDEQKLARSLQFSRTAKKKVLRAVDVISAVDEAGLHPDRRGTFRRAQERMDREAVWAGVEAAPPIPSQADSPPPPDKSERISAFAALEKPAPLPEASSRPEIPRRPT